MNLPQNGRVVIIDDKIEEGLPLVKVLAKNGVPATYFTGLDKDELPSEPIQDVRLVFLDIVIGPKQSDKNQIATVGNILRRIIGPQNSPYILIAWTKHRELIDKILDISGVCLPIITLNLEKYKSMEENYDLSKIEVRLKQELKKAGIFHVFILWENIVHKSANRIIKEFSSFYDYDENWNGKLSDVFFHLAAAYAGKQLKKNNKKDIIQKGLLTFNGTFLDTLENFIRRFIPPDITINFDSTGSISGEICAKINSKLLLLDSSKTNSVHPGNIYEIDNTSKHKPEIAELFHSTLDNYKERDEFLAQLRYVLLEVSPTCDFAQNKWKNSRLLSGVMWPEKHFRKIKKADYIYKSPYFEANGNIFYLVFDLRFLTSLSFDTLKKKKPVFRVKHEFLVDVQSCLARHMNRPGVISLD
jgi:hypothetical protein